ncbi:MAG: hypothetical protein V4805_18370 [Pseudomonadota bacterium]
MKNSRISLTLMLVLALSVPTVQAEVLPIKAGDTMQKQVALYQGKRITVRLQSGEEISGIVRNATPELLHLTEISGKELFDAIIDINKINAIMVRAK